jgi:CRP-like cAMP-binding protein
MTRATRSQSQPPPEQPDTRPLLGESQLTVLRRYGTEHRVADGEILFADGDQTYDMIVLLDGAIQIVEHQGQPDELVIITYGPREFVGEMGLLTGQSVYLSAVAISDGRILRISAAQVKVVMSEEPDLSELILRAFLLRHSRLTNRGSGPVLVGSRFDADTRRLLEVLARNRLSSRWLEGSKARRRPRHYFARSMCRLRSYQSSSFPVARSFVIRAAWCCSTRSGSPMRHWKAEPRCATSSLSVGDPPD